MKLTIDTDTLGLSFAQYVADFALVQGQNSGALDTIKGTLELEANRLMRHYHEQAETIRLYRRLEAEKETKPC